MTRNAIRLLGLMGFNEKIISDAQVMAGELARRGMEYQSGTAT